MTHALHIYLRQERVLERAFCQLANILTILHLLNVRHNRLMEAIIDRAIQVENAPLPNHLGRKSSHWNLLKGSKTWAGT